MTLLQKHLLCSVHRQLLFSLHPHPLQLQKVVRLLTFFKNQQHLWLESLSLLPSVGVKSPKMSAFLVTSSSLSSKKKIGYYGACDLFDDHRLGILQIPPNSTRLPSQIVFGTTVINANWMFSFIFVCWTTLAPQNWILLQIFIISAKKLESCVKNEQMRIVFLTLTLRMSYSTKWLR